MLFELVERVAKKKGMKVEKLPNGVVIVVKENYAYVQIAAVRDVYYIRYLTKDEAYITRRLSERLVEKILDGQLGEGDAIKISNA